MKNLFVTILLIYVCTQQIYAQNRVGLIGGGLYARSNLSDQNQKGVLYQSSTTFGGINSFFGGIMYDIKVTNEFSIKTKVLYINKGWIATNSLRRDTIEDISALNVGTVSVPIESKMSKETYKFSYLELPVNFSVYAPLGKSLLSFGAGPYISLGLSGEYKFKLNSSKYVRIDSPIVFSYLDMMTRPHITKIFTDTVRKLQLVEEHIDDSSSLVYFGNGKNQKAAYTAFQVDYGACLEASLSFRMGLYINASYTAGVRNVIKGRYGALQNKHRVIMIGLGYHLKKKSRHNK